MPFKLSPGVVTIRQLRRCQQELQAIADASKTFDHAQPGPELAELLGNNEAFVRAHTPRQVLAQLDELAAGAPVFEIIAAAEPSDAFLQDVVGWLRRNLHPQALAACKVRSEIAGGIIQRSRNRIYDFSFRPKLVAAKHHLAEVLGHV